MSASAIVFGPQGCGKTTVHVPELKRRGYVKIEETNNPRRVKMGFVGADVFEATRSGELKLIGKGTLR